MANSIGYRTYRKPSLIYENADQNLISKITIHGVVLESENYAKKFKETNCFIYYSNNFYIIEKIEAEVSSYNLICVELVTERININTYKKLNHGERKNLCSDLNFEKALPIFVNKELYLCRRPNSLFNE